MNVAELIAFLQTQPQDLPVAYQRYSEAVILDDYQILIVEACEPRPDGWVHRSRPDKPTIRYLMFPGN